MRIFHLRFTAKISLCTCHSLDAISVSGVQLSFYTYRCDESPAMILALCRGPPGPRFGTKQRARAFQRASAFHPALPVRVSYVVSLQLHGSPPARPLPPVFTRTSLILLLGETTMLIAAIPIVVADIANFAVTHC